MMLHSNTFSSKPLFYPVNLQSAATLATQIHSVLATSTPQTILPAASRTKTPLPDPYEKNFKSPL
jgi:hypothetical protein